MIDMLYVWIAIIIIILLSVLYVLSTRCGGKHPTLRKLRPWAYAHRGLHDAAKPENSMSAFRAALAGGYGVELDVHLLKDGTLAVIHDSSLMRTTGAEGRVEDLDSQDLWNYHLEGTSETIPTFREVLDLFNGKVPLIIELKCVDNNYAALCQAVCDRLDKYKGLYCLESFDPRCVHWLKKNRPDVVRGQLAENYFRSDTKLPWILRLCLTCQLFNFITRPHFVAYKFADRQRLGNTLVKKLWGATRVAWTLQNQEEYVQAKKEGWIPIFENFTP